MEKVKYELDPHNRLTVAKAIPKGVREVLDGQFKVSEQNTLTYHVKNPASSNVKNPYQIKLKGEWSLTKEHQLRFTLDKTAEDASSDELIFQGQILDARKNSLLFAVIAKNKNNQLSAYTLTLSGSWQADAHNRLSFKADKEGGSSSLLAFEGSWCIDNNYQVIYRYQQTQLARKEKKAHTLIFKGYWDIGDRARLSYILDADTDSRFDFNAAIGIFKENYIKYELGIGLTRRKHPLKQTIAFCGKWMLKKNVGLVFEVRSEKGRIQEFVFGAEAKLTDRDSVKFNLRNNLNKQISAELELSRDIFDGDGQIFLRLLKGKQEAAIIAGGGWRW